MFATVCFGSATGLGLIAFHKYPISQPPHFSFLLLFSSFLLF